MFAHTEVFSNGRWQNVGGAVIDATYAPVLARLAGVCNTAGLTPLADPRGLPTDHTYQVHCARYMPGHTGADPRVTSWFTLAELRDEDWARFCEAHRLGSDFVQVIDRMIGAAAAADDARLVFWFGDADHPYTIADLERDSNRASQPV